MWARLERSSTDSWMTVHVQGSPLERRILEQWVARFFPGWELVTYCQECPDSEQPLLFPGEFVDP